jgi:hypothetical protein
MNEEAMAGVMPQCHNKNKYIYCIVMFFFSEIYTESGYEPG